MWKISNIIHKKARHQKNQKNPKHQKARHKEDSGKQKEC